MPTLSQLQLAPPKAWQDFETLCCDLWRAIWKDPNAKKHGRQGQAQHGVDVFGNPSQQADWAGVQCKGKDNYTDKMLTEKELREEAEKAKSFTPGLTQFTLATTGPRDAHIQETARTLSDEHSKAGLFTVDVWSWEDIVESLEQYPEVVEKHYPQFALAATLHKGLDQIDATQRESLSRQAEAVEKIDTLTTAVAQVGQRVISLPDSLLAVYHDNALDLARQYLNDNKPSQALDYLEQQKKLIWSQATPQVKARLLMVMAAAKLGLGEERCAAELFLEAVQHSPDDEKAISNSAIAFLLLDDFPQALTRANQVLSTNPANYQARSVAIQASQEPLDDVVTGLPAFCRDNQDVAFALAAVARRQGNIEQAVCWYRAASKGKSVSPEIKALLGQTLLERLQGDKQSPFRLAQITDVIRTELEEIERLLTEAWTAVPEEMARRSRLSWIINRGIVRRILGKRGDAKNDFAEALGLSPDHPVALYLSAAIADDEGDTAKALVIAKAIQPSDDIPHLPLFIADLLLRSKRPRDAVEHLEACIQNGLSPEVEQSAKEMLVEAYQENDDWDAAWTLCESLLNTDVSDVRSLVAASQISRNQRATERADTLIARASRSLSPSTPLSHILFLGDVLYALERYGDAATAYERVVQPSLNTSLTRRYLNACYQASRLDKALEVCACLRTKHGQVQYVAEMESAIYEETGDLVASQRVCEEYLEATPNDPQMRIRLAVVQLRRQNYEAVDAFLSNPPDWKRLPLNFAIQVANLFAVRERYREATEMMYRIRRRHPKGKVHLRYIQSFLFHGGEGHDWLEAVEVAANTAVCIEDATGKAQWFILEDDGDARVEAGEITKSHRLWGELLGKQVGDTVLLRDSVISPEQGRITEIKSKYVHAFQECSEMLQIRYPEVEGFFALHLPKDAEAGVQKVLSLVGEQHDAVSRAIQAYREDCLPVSGLAHCLGRNVIEAWSIVVHRRDAGLRCCMGTLQERHIATELLQKEPRPTLVVDPVSLMTIDWLGIRDDVVRIVGRLGIAQATIDLLSETLHKRRAVNRDGFLTLDKEGDTFVKQEVSSQDVERSLAWLETLLNWINSHCDVLSWPVSIKMARSDRQRLSEILGEESVETMLVAAGDGRVLFSDDQWLRRLAAGELGVNGVWTQAILGQGLDSGSLEREQYNQAVISLVSAGYVHTGIDAQVLLAAARKAEWRPAWPFDVVANALRGSNCDEQSAVRVAVEFIAVLWNEVVLPESFDYLVLRLLDSLVHQRSPRHVLNGLAGGIKQRFALNPIAEQDVLRFLGAWVSMRIA